MTYATVSNLAPLGRMFVKEHYKDYSRILLLICHLYGYIKQLL